jgi:hypothetical protein
VKPEQETAGIASISEHADSEPGRCVAADFGDALDHRYQLVFPSITNCQTLTP